MNPINHMNPLYIGNPRFTANDYYLKDVDPNNVSAPERSILSDLDTMIPPKTDVPTVKTGSLMSQADNSLVGMYTRDAGRHYRVVLPYKKTGDGSSGHSFVSIYAEHDPQPQTAASWVSVALEYEVPTQPRTRENQIRRRFPEITLGDPAYSFLERDVRTKLEAIYRLVFESQS